MSDLPGYDSYKLASPPEEPQDYEHSELGEVYADLSRARAQVDQLAGLLREALALMEDDVDNREGRDNFDLECGNCVAGVPVAHSFGCRAYRALRMSR